MYTFLNVLFWFYVVAAIIRVLILCFANYPRTEKTSVAMDVIALLIVLGIGGTLGYLLFIGGTV